MEVNLRTIALGAALATAAAWTAMQLIRDRQLGIIIDAYNRAEAELHPHEVDAVMQSARRITREAAS